MPRLWKTGISHKEEEFQVNRIKQKGKRPDSAVDVGKL